MALFEELNDERSNKPSPTQAWVTQWYKTLDPVDQQAFDDYVADPTKEAAPLWRVCKRRGYPFTENPFREWVVAQRQTEWTDPFTYKRVDDDSSR